MIGNHLHGKLPGTPMCSIDQLFCLVMGLECDMPPEVMRWMEDLAIGRKGFDPGVAHEADLPII